MTDKTIVVWYRNDLRLHDHEALHQALATGAQILPLYCFDPRQFTQTSFGFPKTGTFRGQFLLESVADLRATLQRLGGDLVVRSGLPEVVIPAIVHEVGATAVYFHKEVTSEETSVEAALTDALSQMGTRFESFWTHTLCHLEDLPFAIENLPELFTNFRQQGERSSTIYTTRPTPTTIPLAAGVAPGEILSLAALALVAPIPDSRSVLAFQGGETAGLARLNHYIWEQDHLKSYKQTRNQMLGADYSTKFSAWLSLGCLSPRRIYESVKDYEAQRVANESTYWLIFELFWRDYFYFIAAKHGDRLFRKSGLQGREIPWQDDWERLDLWREGKTGFPLVDANMRELAATGFMSNRGRQNVASFLTKNLGINWQMGAEWFESLLIDYDVCSNWGNWNYTAGVGNDARGFRFFNIVKQSKDYDPDGTYVKHWLPELAKVPASKIHEPWKLSTTEQSRFGVKLGVDYPEAIVDLFKSAEANKRLYNAGV